MKYICIKGYDGLLKGKTYSVYDLGNLNDIHRYWCYKEDGESFVFVKRFLNKYFLQIVI